MRDIDLFQLALGLVPPWMVAAANFDAEQAKQRARIKIARRTLELLKARKRQSPGDPGAAPER